MDNIQKKDQFSLETKQTEQPTAKEALSSAATQALTQVGSAYQYRQKAKIGGLISYLSSALLLVNMGISAAFVPLQHEPLLLLILASGGLGGAGASAIAGWGLTRKSNQKVDEICQNLHISRKDLFKAIASNKVVKLIQLALEAKSYRIPYATLEEAQKSNTLDEVRHLKQLADRFELPLKELLVAKERGQLPQLIQAHEQIERKCACVFAKLDALYQENKLYLDQDFDLLSAKNLETVKKTVKTAFKVLEQHPQERPGVEVEAVISICSRVKVFVKSSGDSFTVTPLFGKVLGGGGGGLVLEVFDLLQGAPTPTHRGALKVPKMQSHEANQDIENEVRIINKIQEDGDVLGVQKRVTLVSKPSNVQTGKSELLGDVYQFDGSRANIHTWSLEEQSGAAYQLFHGVAATQMKNISHGDIKPENIFCNGTRLYLSDFGGAIDHSVAPHIQEDYSYLYRLKKDAQLAEAAFKKGDLATFREIEMKCDSFASSAAFITMATKDFPFDDNLLRYSKQLKLNTDVIERLITKGFSRKFVDMLILGLNEDYQKRPTSQELFTAASQECQRIALQQWSMLQKVSSKAPISA